MKIETLNRLGMIFKILYLNKKRNKIVCFIFLLSFFSSMSSFSQSLSKQVAPNAGMVQVDDYLVTLKTLPQTSNNISPYNRLESLLREVQSSIYLTKGVVSTYGKNPVCIYSDVSSFDLLNSKLPLNNDVEILTIKIESSSDLKSPIDICSFTNLNKLKYIYLQINFDCKPNELSQFIKNCKTDHVVIYKIEKGA